jgi:hypothetical protein
MVFQSNGYGVLVTLLSFAPFFWGPIHISSYLLE